MLIRYATLAALSDRPRRVTDICRELLPLLSLFRPLTFGQIRNTAHRLQREGLATAAAPTDRHPADLMPSVTLRLTPAGQHALNQWFRLPPARTTVLDARRARIHSAMELPSATALEELRHCDRDHLQHRRRLLQARQTNSVRDTPHAWLLYLAIQQIEIELLWLEELGLDPEPLPSGRAGDSSPPGDL